MYNSLNIRNVLLVGSKESGKSKLLENILEKKINSFENQINIAHLEVSNVKINFIDTIGDIELMQEEICSTTVAKGAVLVIDGSKKIDDTTIRMYRLLLHNHIPTIIFINKMDEEGINFDIFLNDIRMTLGKNAIPFCYPIGHGDDFEGFVNVVDLKARRYNGIECVDDEIWPEKRLKVLELNNMIIESVAQTNDELLERFFNGEQFTKEEVHQGLRKGVLDGELLPVIVGSAKKKVGLHTLVSMLIDYLPRPSDLKSYVGVNENNELTERKTTDEESFSAFCFKTYVDPFLGVLNVIKINSGVLSQGDEVYNSTTKEKVKIDKIGLLNGRDITYIDEAHSGDIVVCSKINISTSNTLCSSKNIITYDKIKVLSPLSYVAIKCVKQKDEDKIGTALKKIQLEDISLEFKRHKETGQLLLGVQGLTHLDVILKKLKDVYKIEVETQDQEIVYRETIRKEAVAEGRYIKQSGGSGFYGVVKMRFEPTTENSSFHEEVFGGAVPKNYFPAVEKGFEEALEEGLLAHYPVTNIKATLLDGKYHPVDSNEQAFKMAAILAFKEAYLKASPTILEPIMKLFITIKQNDIGDVLGDLNRRRARILGMNVVDEEYQEIEVLVPEAEIISYNFDLKQLTQGTATFTREFYKYEILPDYLVEKIVSKRNNLK